MKNLTGEYPKFIHMRGTGFAIRGLGATYVMVSDPPSPPDCDPHFYNVTNYRVSPAEWMNLGPVLWSTWRAFTITLDFITILLMWFLR